MSSKTDIGLPAKSPWVYLPSIPANSCFVAIYAVFMFVTLFHILRRSRRARWGWVLPAGFFFASIGYGLRLPRSFSALSSVTLYAVQYMCVVLSPCAFLAFNYIVFGRFIVALDPDLKEEGKQRKRQKSRLTFIPPRLVGRGFIISDVCTFLIQATGGGLQSAGGSQRPVGDKIFVVGLVLQAVSYAGFWTLVLETLRRLRTEDASFKLRRIFSNDPAMRLFGLINLSSIFVMIRSIFRIIEMVQGYSGFLASRETFLISFDTVQMLAATVVWVVQWPAALIDSVEEERCAPIEQDAAASGTVSATPSSVEHNLEKS